MAFKMFSKSPKQPVSKSTPSQAAPVQAKPAEPAVVGFPEPVGGIGNLDLFAEGYSGFEFDEQEILQRVEKKVEEGKFTMPHLPSTQMALLDLTATQDTDMGKVESLVSADMVLTATLLKAANSVMYGGTRQIDSVRAAVVRMGLKGLRSILYAQSLKSVIFRAKGLEQFAQEIWRQATSVATTARSLAVPLCLDPERTFVLGLLHDVGKIPVLELLRTEAPEGFSFRRPFVGAALGMFHERVGRKLTETWNLPQEIVEVSGCHHEFEKNVTFSKSAALVNLAHRQDLYLSCGDQEKYESLLEYPAMGTIGLSEPNRLPLLETVKASYLAGHADKTFD